MYYKYTISMQLRGCYYYYKLKYCKRKSPQIEISRCYMILYEKIINLLCK